MKQVRIAAGLIFSGLIIVYLYNGYSKNNPFNEVSWVEEYPGATERYVQFTPVSKVTKLPIGPTVGADFASLRFIDLDNDGIKEAIIETECWLDLGEFYYPQRHVLKFETVDGTGKFLYMEGDGPDKNKDSDN